MKHLDDILSSAYEVEEIFTGKTPERVSSRGQLPYSSRAVSSVVGAAQPIVDSSASQLDLDSIRSEIYTRVSGDIFHEQERAVAERIAEIWKHILDKHTFSGRYSAASLDAGAFLPSAVDLRKSDAFASGPIAVIVYAHRYYLSRNASLHEIAAFLEVSREMNLGPADVFASFSSKKRNRSLLAELGFLRATLYTLTCVLRIISRRRTLNLLPFRKGDLFRDKMIVDLAFQAWGVSRGH